MKDLGEFIAFMCCHDDDDAPDGAWFARLEGAGEEWLKDHPEPGLDGNDMAHRYLTEK